MNNFKFVDNIRFVSIFAIVFFHSSNLFLEFNKEILVYNEDTQWQVLTWLQFMRFGNVCFFMISGFLIGYKIKTTSNPVEYYDKYLSKRWQNLKFPTLLFSTINAFYFILTISLKYFLKHQPIDIIDSLIGFITHFFFDSTWFIYNLFVSFICLSAIIYFPKFKNHIYIFFIIISIGFGAFPYLFPEIGMKHTSTFLGFTLYVLFGFFLGENYSLFEKICELINKNKIIFLFLLIGIHVITIIDAKFIYLNTNTVPSYNLRILSQIKSILIFFCLAAFSNKNFYPKFLDPKRETVGLYFFHTFLLQIFQLSFFGILFLLFKISSNEQLPENWILPLMIINSIFIYISSTLAVKWIIKMNWGKILGVPKETIKA